MASTTPPRAVTYKAATKDRGVRLDLFLKGRIPRMSREGIKEAIRTRVIVPGREAVRPSTLLREGEEVVVTYAVAEKAAPGSFPDLTILLEDESVLVVDKPAGLRVHATASAPGPSLLGCLASRGEDLRLVHRLDKETSGVVVLARSREAARALSKAFAAGEVGKTYTGIVFGEIEKGTGLVDLPLGAAKGSAVHIKQAVNTEAGRRAVSEYRVLERFRGFTVVEIRPRTGRRHQIRVHMKAIGHPLVGDKLYGSRESHHLRFLERGMDERMLGELKAERQLLHASRVVFLHPGGTGPVRVEAPLPEDMVRFIAGHRS